MQSYENVCFETTTEAGRAALEVISPLLMWVNQAATLKQRGLRATVILYCFGSQLINGATLEEIGTQVGCSRQAVHKVLVNFRKVVKAMAQTPPPLFSALLKAA
jgi:hypothetical protein